MDAQYAETIVFRFIGYNLLGTAVRDASGLLSGLSVTALKASDSIGQNMAKAGGMVAGLGTAMMVGATLFGAAMVYAGSKAADFQSQIILLHTQARVATDQLSALSQGVLNMAGAVGQTPSELAQALYFIESVGGGSYTTAHALDELKAAAMGAAVGHANLTDTAQALASVMAVFPGMLPIQAMGQLDAIVGQGKMTMEDLNAALKTGILATLQSSGVSLADFGGALATMTDYAIPAGQAANALRMAIYLMDAPTAASNKVLEQFGLTSKEAAASSKAWVDALEAAGIRHAQLADDLRKPGGIILAMQDLQKHFVAAGLSADAQAEVIYKAFGGGKMGKAVITLFDNITGGTRASNAELVKLGFTQAEIANLSDRLVNKTALINQQTNLLGKNFQYIQQNDPVQMWNQLKSSIDSLVITLGQAFLPIIISFVRWLTPLVQQFATFVEGHKQLVANIMIGIAAFLAIGGAILFVVGTVGMIVGTFLAIGALGITASILPIIGVMLLVGVVIGIVAYLVVTHWKQIGAFFSALGTKAQEVKAAVLNFVSSVGTFFSNFGNTVHTIWNSIVDTVGRAAQELHDRPIYWITRMILFVPGLLFQLIPQIEKWVGQTTAWAIRAGNDFLNNVVKFVQQLPGTILKWLGSVVATIANWTGNLVKQAGITFGNFVTQIWNTITKTDWLGLGEKIIQGLIDGIKSMGKNLLSAVGNTASQIYQGFKDAFGIKSPSVVMAMGVGVPLAQGIQMGFQNQIPTVQRNVTTAVNNLGVVSIKGGQNMQAQKQIVTKAVEDKLDEVIALLRQINGDEGQISAFAAQQRVG